MITRQNALHTVTSVVNELYDRYETEHEALARIAAKQDPRLKFRLARSKADGLS